MVVLFSALTGMIVGSLGTVVIFWLCGALQRKTVTETVSDKVNPELKDATIQAEDTQAIYINCTGRDVRFQANVKNSAFVFILFVHWNS